MEHLINCSLRIIISYLMNDRLPTDPNDQTFEEFLNLKHLEEIMKLFQSTDDLDKSDGVFNRCAFSHIRASTLHPIQYTRIHSLSKSVSCVAAVGRSTSSRT